MGIVAKARTGAGKAAESGRPRARRAIRPRRSIHSKHPKHYQEPPAHQEEARGEQNNHSGIVPGPLHRCPRTNLLLDLTPRLRSPPVCALHSVFSQWLNGTMQLSNCSMNS
jgi:hypothetical protein